MKNKCLGKHMVVICKDLHVDWSKRNKSLQNMSRVYCTVFIEEQGGQLVDALVRNETSWILYNSHEHSVLLLLDLYEVDMWLWVHNNYYLFGSLSLKALRSGFGHPNGSFQMGQERVMHFQCGLQNKCEALGYWKLKHKSQKKKLFVSLATWLVVYQ